MGYIGVQMMVLMVDVNDRCWSECAQGKMD